MHPLYVPPSDEVLTLGAVGDLYLGQPIRGESHPGFRAAIDALRGCDLRLANLEFQLLDGPTAGAAAAPGAWAGAPAALGEELRWLGLHAVSTANNHAGDYGSEGQRSTLAALRRLGIAQAGCGEHLDEARAPALIDTPQGRVAVLAVSSSHLAHARAGRQRSDAPGRPGVSPLRFGTRYQVDDAAYAALERILEQMPVQDLAAHRERPLERAYGRERDGTLSFFGTAFVRAGGFGVESWAADDDLADLSRAIADARTRAKADWVILSLHSHEYDSTPAMPAAFAIQASRRAVEAGADAVIGHGEHGVRGMELYRGCPIFYGIGAFVFQPYLFPSQPADFFEAYAMGDAPLAEAYRVRRERAGFYARRSAWEAMFVRLALRRGAPPGFEIHPITLWPSATEAPDGLPHLAHDADGLALLEKVRDASAQLGTQLELDAQAFRLTHPESLHPPIKQGIPA